MQQGGSIREGVQLEAATSHDLQSGRPSARRFGEVATFGLLLVLGAWQVSDLWSSQDNIVAHEAGRLVATGRLEEVLYDPALGGREEGPSVSQTFTDEAGHDCRSFKDGSVTGIACQQGGDWRLVEIRQK